MLCLIQTLSTGTLSLGQIALAIVCIVGVPWPHVAFGRTILEDWHVAMKQKVMEKGVGVDDMCRCLVADSPFRSLVPHLYAGN
jgi:hypothetical protein